MSSFCLDKSRRIVSTSCNIGGSDLVIEDSFRELTKRVFELHRLEDYAKAYELVTNEGPRYPERENTTFYWRVCLASRIGDTELALGLFEQALDAGHWFWTTGLREDPDLEQLRGLPRFEKLVSISAERQEDVRTKANPNALVFEPESGDPDSSVQIPLLLAMHGNYSTAQDAAKHWRTDSSNHWLVVLPQSTQPGGPGTFVWNDRDWTEEEIKFHYASIADQYEVDKSRTILAGFSMGARWAIWFALTGLLPANGFVAISPFLPDPARFKPLIAAVRDRQLRGYLLVGEQDKEAKAGALEVSGSRKNEGLACELEIHPNLGHDYPTEFDEALDRVLEYVSQARA